jgi:uncharacterized membrane protein
MYTLASNHHFKRGEFMYYLYKRDNKGFILSIISIILTIISIILAIIFLVERKKKQEEKELDDYLENSIQ